MVNLTIDGREITVKENTTIMEAASQNGIPIPKLCYLKGHSYEQSESQKTQKNNGRADPFAA